MATNDQIGKAIRNAVRDDSAIRSKCQDLFTLNHSVWYGAVGRKGSQKDDDPVYTVIPLGKERGENESETERIFTFLVGLQIKDSNSTEATTAAGVKTVEFRGPKSLEELLDLAMTAIRAISTELSYDDKTFEYEPPEFFPVFHGTLVLTVTYPILIGGYEPTIS